MSELKWAQPLLGDVAAVVDPHPSHRAPPEVDGGVPFVGIGDLTERGEVLASSARKVSPKVLDEHKTRYSVAKGDIAYGRVATVGKVMRFGEINEPFALSPTMALIQPHGVDASYLAHFLQSKQWDDESAKLLTGTTRSSLGIQLLRKIRISCPSTFEEQETIGSVLDTLDTAIHETEAIIAKLKAVKQGLLHDLLTRGIDSNGELRPPQSEAPHLYKESRLGWIPKEWDSHVFGDTIEHVIDFRGRTPRKLGMDWGGGDILALSANNVQPGGIDVSREAYFGGERLYSRWMTSGDVRKGDVLLTMEAPLGNVAQIPDDARYILSQRVIALRFKPAMVLNDFAFWQMQSTEFQRVMVKRSTGSTATGIQRAELVRLHFKAPPVDEQSWIAQRLFSVEQKLASELVALDKQKQEKSGLMDDLLTGRVRVTPLLAEAAQQQGSA